MIKVYSSTPNMIIGRDTRLHYFLKDKWMMKIDKLKKPMIIVKEKWTKGNRR